MAAPAKVEFAVQMTCNNCAEKVKKALTGVQGINSVEVNLPNEQVFVETTLPSEKVRELIEKTGKRAVVQGYGSSQASKHLGAAVAIIEEGNKLVRGVTRMVQLDQNKCVIEGTIDGLTPGKHQLAVHEAGDISHGCRSCGDVFNPERVKKGRILGALGEISADDSGRAMFRIEDDQLKLWDVIGRSVVVHAGKQEVEKASDSRLACGIIARSAGLFQNSKRICACDGVVVWDERDVPVAGAGRQNREKTPTANL